MLSTAKHKWFEIGMQLGLPYHKLEEFKEKRDPLAAVIDYWLRLNVKDVPVTWRSIVDALKSDQVDESGLAKSIEEKYHNKENHKDMDFDRGKRLAS